MSMQLNVHVVNHLEYQLTNIIKIDRDVDRVGRCNQTLNGPIGERHRSMDGVHWRGAG